MVRPARPRPARPMRAQELVALCPFGVVEHAVLVAVEERPDDWRSHRAARAAVSAAMATIGLELRRRGGALGVVQAAVVVAIEAMQHRGRRTLMRRARPELGP